MERESQSGAERNISSINRDPMNLKNPLSVLGDDDSFHGEMQEEGFYVIRFSDGRFEAFKNRQWKHYGRILS